MSTYDQLTEIFQDVFDNDEIVATPELTAADVDEWDSLSHIRIIVAVEDAFNIKFSISEISELQNVGQMAALVEGKTG